VMSFELSECAARTVCVDGKTQERGFRVISRFS
jgi:hypothetical protein